ncbi:hypothetical protein D3C81_1362820 [compost metagenome]
MARRRKVVLHRIVLRGAVVPQRDGVRLPLQAHLILGRGGLAEQVLQQVQLGRAEIGADAVRLYLAEIVEMGGEAFVDEQDLLASLRMGAHYRMHHRRILLAQFLDLGIGEGLAEGRHGVMHGAQPGDLRLHLVRQVLVRRHHVHPDGVAAHLGAAHASQHRTHRRHLAPRHVGVVEVLAATRAAVTAKHHQFRVLRMMRDHRMHLQLAKAACHGHVLCRRDVLVAEEQHLELQKRAAQGEVGLVVERPGEVDAGNLGTDRGGRTAHAKRPGFGVLGVGPRRGRVFGDGGCCRLHGCLLVLSSWECSPARTCGAV